MGEWWGLLSLGEVGSFGCDVLLFLEFLPTRIVLSYLTLGWDEGLMGGEGGGVGVCLGVLLGA